MQPPDSTISKRDQLEKALQGYDPSRAAPASGAYVFFSFDLVDSTARKIAEPMRWPQLVTTFYDFVSDYVSRYMEGCVLWKFIGDEVVSYTLLSQPNQISTVLEKVAEAMVEFEKSAQAFRLPFSRGVALKSAVWLANCRYIEPHDLKQEPKVSFENLVVQQPVYRHDDQALDFLGPDMDTGFRIAKHVEKRRIVLSANLGLLLATIPELEVCSDCCRIVGFEILKGIWNGRSYPIIWYNRDWSHLEGDLEYDEGQKSSIIRKILETDVAQLPTLSLLPSIFRDIGKEESANQYLAAINANQTESYTPSNWTPSQMTELHCVAVCFARPSGRVLLVRRAAHKRIYPNCWEFGCGRVLPGETVSEALHRAYLNDFHFEIEVPFSGAPVSLYHVDEMTHAKPGIILIGLVSDESSPQLPKKYTEAEWFDQSAIEGLDPQQCVPKLVETLGGAVNQLKLIPELAETSTRAWPELSK